jgi:hypothetical protein
MSQLSRSLPASLEQETKKFSAVQENENSGHNHRLDTHFSTVQALLKEIKNQQRVENDKLVLVEKELQSATSAFSTEAFSAEAFSAEAFSAEAFSAEAFSAEASA